MNGSEVEAYFNAIDYGVFTFLLICSLAIGIYFGFFSKELKTAEDYMIGGHKMKVVPIAVSLMSSQLSALSIISTPSEIYSFGWQSLLVLPSLIFVTIVTNVISLPVFYCNNIQNIYAYLEMRFGKITRKVLTIMFIILNLFFLPVIMFIPSLAFTEVTKHDIQVVNIIISYICVIYTMLGGIKAVVWTDVLQAIIMIVSVILVACLGVSKTGGLEEVWDRAVEGGRIFPPNMSMSLTTRITFWNTVSSMLFGWISYIGFNQNCAQRLISLPSLQHARRAMIVFFIGVVIILGFNNSIGIIMYSYYHGCDPVKAQIVAKYDKLVPRFVRDVAGHIPAMSGIFISCVFSASLSTVSASIHANAGIIYSDYVRPLKLFKHTDVNANRSMRFIIFLLGTLCAFSGIVVERFNSLFQITSTVAGIVTGAKFGVFTLGMLYPWANQKGALTGIIVSVAVVSIIVANTQYNIAHGHLVYNVIPTSIDKCDNETLARIQPTKWTPSPPLNESDDGFEFYKISFQWYPMIGVVMFWIPAVIVSHLSGGQDLSKLNVQLLSPFIRNLIPEKYRHTMLERNEKKIPNPKIIEDNQNMLKQELTELITKNDETSTP